MLDRISQQIETRRRLNKSIGRFHDTQSTLESRGRPQMLSRNNKRASAESQNQQK